MLHTILIPIGSSGDVHPFIGIGIALRARGHRVTVITNGHFEPLVRRVGLEFVEFGTAAHYLAVTENPDLWHPVRGFKAVMDSFTTGLPDLYRAITEQIKPGPTVLVGSSLALPARIVQEKLGVPLVTVHLSPAVLRSVYESPRLPGLPMPDGMPHFIKRSMYWLADTLVVDRLLGPPVNAMRKEVGLPPVRGIMRDWWHSPIRTIGMFPEWFAPPQPDWPPQVRLTGFPLYDERGAVDTPPEVETFFNAGGPPIIFTPGSAMRHGRKFFEAATEACTRLNRRGVLLTRFPEQIPPSLPPHVRHFDFIPLSQVLPRAAALVCHGGVGTVSQGLAAGVPQLVMPLAHDQFDNAARLKRLGVGDSLRRASFSGPRVAQKLKQLLDSPAVAERCREVAGKFKGVDAIAQTCDYIEAAR